MGRPPPLIRAMPERKSFLELRPSLIDHGHFSPESEGGNVVVQHGFTQLDDPPPGTLAYTSNIPRTQKYTAVSCKYG